MKKECGRNSTDYDLHFNAGFFDTKFVKQVFHTNYCHHHHQFLIPTKWWHWL